MTVLSEEQAANLIKKKTALYLDDRRTPKDSLPDYDPWVVVRNFKEFGNYIVSHGIPDLISFDHDLANEHYAPAEYWNGDYEMWAQFQTFKEPTGLDCMKWLIAICETNPHMKINRVSIHSFNKARSYTMRELMNDYKKHRGWDQDCFETQYAFTE